MNNFLNTFHIAIMFLNIRISETMTAMSHIVELNYSNTDGSFTTAVSNSFFESLGKYPIAADFG